MVFQKDEQGLQSHKKKKKKKKKKKENRGLKNNLAIFKKSA